MCPLFVAGAWYGKCFLTASDVKPGHVVNMLFSHALMSVVFGRLNRYWCLNLISEFLEVRAYVLFAV